jgi:nicotinate-nucleotide adenylyltransferase
LRLGILGGTFDPIHLGHLRAAEEIGEALNLEKVYLIPSASPPHKAGEPVTSFQHRWAMVHLAADASPRLDAMDLEGRRPGLSYSIETLREFHSLFGPAPDLFFILGVDAFLEIRTWKEYRDLFDYAHFVVIRRPGYSMDSLGPLLLDLGLEGHPGGRTDQYTAASGKQLLLMTTTLMDISATRIRQMVASGRSIRFLVPETVQAYIRQEELYRDHGIPC